MKTRTRVLAVTLASLIPLTALAACGGSDSDSGSGTTAYAKAVDKIQGMADATREIFCPELAQVGYEAERDAFTANYRRTNPSEKTMTADEAWIAYYAAVDC